MKSIKCKGMEDGRQVIVELGLMTEFVKGETDASRIFIVKVSSAYSKNPGREKYPVFYHAPKGILYFTELHNEKCVNLKALASHLKTATKTAALIEVGMLGHTMFESLGNYEVIHGDIKPDGTKIDIPTGIKDALRRESINHSIHTYYSKPSIGIPASELEEESPVHESESSPFDPATEAIYKDMLDKMESIEDVMGEKKAVEVEEEEWVTKSEPTPEPTPEPEPEVEMDDAEIRTQIVTLIKKIADDFNLYTASAGLGSISMRNELFFTTDLFTSGKITKDVVTGLLNVHWINPLYVNKRFKGDLVEETSNFAKDFYKSNDKCKELVKLCKGLVFSYETKCMVPMPLKPYQQEILEINKGKYGAHLPNPYLDNHFNKLERGVYRALVLIGERGSGKSDGAYAYFTNRGYPVTGITGNPSLEPSDLLRTPVAGGVPDINETLLDIIANEIDVVKNSELISEEDKAVFVDALIRRRTERTAIDYVPSAFIKAAEDGSVHVVDEGNAINATTLMIFNEVLDSKESITVPGHGTVRVHPNFRLIFTANPFYEGTRKWNISLINRMTVVYCNVIDTDTSVAIMDSRFSMLSIATKGKSKRPTKKAKAVEPKPVKDIPFGDFVIDSSIEEWGEE